MDFFKFIPDAIIETLLTDATEVIFQKDQYIVKEGEKAKYVYVVMRGVCSEYTNQGFSTYNEKKGVGGIISPHHIVLPRLRYLTSCVAEAMVYTIAFNIDTLSKIVRRIK